ncbi:MAG TPA: FecR domain-containing protein [Terriglobales bacterium]|nr:FecR domain-containing protein [Terriglobales bacterium]
MKGTHNNPDYILDQAIAAVRDDHANPQAEQMATANAWQRISQAIGVEATLAPLNRIEGCADVLRLLPDFEAHKLVPARAMLVADHLRECATCRVQANTHKSTGSILPWRADSVVRPQRWSLGQYALAASLVIAAVLGVAIGRGGWLAPSGYRAALESVQGTLYRVDASGEHRVQPGDKFGEGEAVRTASGSRAMLRLRDGSLVEMNGRSELYISVGWRNTSINLGRGIVIVQAAKRRTGHLYVQTADARVAVTGTIFSVNSGIKGSRVSVIEGTVHVAQAGGDAVLRAGDQVTTNAAVGEVPVRDEIAWSENRDKYLALLAEFAKFQKSVIEKVTLPGLRYDSRLLQVVPNGSVVYAGVPNYGEALNQAHKLFEVQLSQSRVLREWWQQQGPGRNNGGVDFNRALETIHSLSQYVGNEIVFSCTGGPGHEGAPLAIAQTVRPGLREFLLSQMQQSKAPQDLHLLSAQDLKTVTPQNRGLYVLITREFVAASPSLSTLAQVNSQWSSTDGSGFMQSDFGKRIASEYTSGAGLLVAVNLEQIESYHASMAQAPHHEEMLQSTGFANVKYLIAQRKDYDGKASNTAELSFNGPRAGIASWLATPAAIGALDFITPNAAAVGAFVSKSPALMVDDLFAIATHANPNGEASLAKAQAELNLDLRNDLAASLGGEAALALDGPLLPTPSWKLIVEVYDPSRLQYSIGKLADAVNRSAAENNRPGLKIDEHEVHGQTFYTIRSQDPLIPAEVHYTFADGYLVAAASQALVRESLRTRSKGDSISHSDNFRALFPADQHANVSGLIYQNLAPVVAPIKGQLSASQLQSMEALVENSEPSVICAYGDENEIELASNSKTLGIDLKTLAISSLLQQLKSGTPRSHTP